MLAVGENLKLKSLYLTTSNTLCPNYVKNTDYDNTEIINTLKTLYVYKHLLITNHKAAICVPINKINTK